MLSIHRQRTRDRVDSIRDTLMASQCQPKDVNKYVDELLSSVGEKVAPAANAARAFMSSNPKMVKGSKAPPKAKPRKS